MLTTGDRLALLMHEHLLPGPGSQGKLGHGLLRYATTPISAVIDVEYAGHTARSVTGITCDTPIVATVAEAVALGANTIVPGIAPPGGVLPTAWIIEVQEALKAKCNLINGLHKPMATDSLFTQYLGCDNWIWDIRKEPAGCRSGTGAASRLTIPRVLTVGTDMAIGKMTVSLEAHMAALRLGLRSEFLATGQIGICISGKGVPLDAVRIDFGPGSIEQLVLDHAPNKDVLWIEGQGSIVHPASTAWLALLRGAAPTHLILCHRAGQTTLARHPDVTIPDLKSVIRMYEECASAAGALARPSTIAVALNTSMLTDTEARACLANVTQQTGLVSTDPVRFGGDVLVQAVMKGLTPSCYQ